MRGNSNITLSGTGVGPVYNDDLSGAVIDFGEISMYSNKTEILKLINESTDGALGGLNNLTIVDIQITDDDGVFSHSGIPDLTQIAALASNDLSLLFNPGTVAGDYTATMTIFTDENAALHGNGSDFVYTLRGTAVPEPSTFALAGVGLLGLLMFIRRRRTRG